MLTSHVKSITFWIFKLFQLLLGWISSMSEKYHVYTGYSLHICIHKKLKLVIQIVLWSCKPLFYWIRYLKVNAQKWKFILLVFAFVLNLLLVSLPAIFVQNFYFVCMYVLYILINRKINSCCNGNTRLFFMLNIWYLHLFPGIYVLASK